MTFKGIFTNLTTIAKAIIPMLMVLATALFLWGVIKFIAHADNEDARSEGRWFMLWGIIGLFFMVAVWGIVNVLFVSFFK